MRADKRKRLQARRWKVGNVQEFLGLTDQDQEAAYIELLRLVKGLEARRNASVELERSPARFLQRASPSRSAPAAFGR
jgi:hypothetical protein